jgi:hypothetical protein
MSEYPNIITPDPNPIISSYSQLDAVGNITDGYTPVNKVGAANTIGMEIAKIANFVNATNLGFSDNPVQTANIKYITYTSVDSGISYTATFGTSALSGVLYAYFRKVNSAYDLESLTCTATSVQLAHNIATSPYLINSILTSSGLFFGAGTYPPLGVSAHLTNSVLQFSDIGGTFNTQYSASGILHNTTSPDFYIKSNQDIRLEANLIPAGALAYSLGTVANPFYAGCFNNVYIFTPSSAYNPVVPKRLWVDISGYVRQGNFV